MTRAPRIAVVSPFLDRRHGTERCVAEQAERLARHHGCEIVLYCQDVIDMCLSQGRAESFGGRITWRKVSKIPGPHLFGFTWWFLANHFARFFDRVTGRFRPDLVYTPGTNCLDADVIGVHIVFAETYAYMRKHLGLRGKPVDAWPRLLHRRIYYRLIMALENRMYRNERIVLAGVAGKVAKDLERRYGRAKDVHVIYHGANEEAFNLAKAAQNRPMARKELGFGESDSVMLLAGNDWQKKGLPALLDAMVQLQDPSVHLLVRGQDDPAPFRDLLGARGLEGRVRFVPQRPDVEWYYAAADVYVGPSLEDSFAMPPLEAMACGVPAIVSRQAGVSELITHGEDGLILEDPTDSHQLARFIGDLIKRPGARKALGASAAGTAQRYTWDANTQALFEIFRHVVNGRVDSSRA